VEIRRTPEVYARWRGGDDIVAAVEEDFAEPDIVAYVIELEGRIVGWIQWQAEDDRDYRHASIDIYVDPAVHGRGVCTDAVRTLARHLIVDHGHHRLEIDPAADNAAAIRCYTKVGFRPSASCAPPNGDKTAAGTTACSWIFWLKSWPASETARGKPWRSRQAMPGPGAGTARFGPIPHRLWPPQPRPCRNSRTSPARGTYRGGNRQMHTEAGTHGTVAPTPRRGADARAPGRGRAGATLPPAPPGTAPVAEGPAVTYGTYHLQPSSWP
jgi:GNAT superfamily N-acetyltransferase